MEIKVKAKYIHQAPRKVRLVADLVRKQPVLAALDQLRNINKIAAGPILKLINSAVAGAEHNFELNKDNLYIKTIMVDGGPVLDRWLPRAQGRATPIKKRMSHLTVVLAEIVEQGGRKKIAKVAAPVRLDYRPKEAEGVLIKDEEEKTAQEGKPADPGEKGKTIIDPRSVGKGKHRKIEGQGARGFVGKLFQRKSG